MLARLLVPSLCAICRNPADPAAPVCGDCIRALNGCRVIRDEPPEGVDLIASCADHDGIARALLAGFKFRHLTGLGSLIAGFMADAAGQADQADLIVPVPPARLRTWFRGFDPVAMLTAEVAAMIEVPSPPGPVLVRVGSGRQRGHGRTHRLSDPPDIRPLDSAGQKVGGRRILLVDDVMTTGATLSTASWALRKAGAIRVSALTFTRRL